MELYVSGDVLKIYLGGYTHYGLYIGDGKVIHNSKKLTKVAESSLDEFSEGQSVHVSKNIKTIDPSRAVKMAKQYLGTPYRLFNGNCEHFVRTTCGMVRESTQVQKGLITALGSTTAIKSESPVLRSAGIGATLGALATSAEESPIQNAVIMSLVFAGVSAALQP